MKEIKTAHDIYAYLAARVIGQGKAKTALASAGFMHMAKTAYWYNNYKELPPVPGSHILILGPTGCGKTHLVKTLAECIGCPMIEIVATALSQEGYKGSNLTDYFKIAHDGTPVAERHKLNSAIVFIDEVDKILGTGNEWHLGLQNSFLKLIEGMHVNIEKDRGSDARLPTHNMLFILGGAFTGIASARLKAQRPMGFLHPEPTPIDIRVELKQYGLIDELLGRLSTVIEIKQLTKSELKKTFLNKEHGILDKYKSLYKNIFKADLELTDYTVDKIINEAFLRNTGARALQSSLDTHLVQDVFSRSIIIDDLEEDEEL